MTAVNVRGGSQSASSARLYQLIRRVAQQESSAQLLEVALPDPARGRELVGVPGDACRGQLVDVGEDQLGELGQRLGRETGLHDGAGQFAPGDPGADPVGG